jgi:hypothetical protein
VRVEIDGIQPLAPLLGFGKPPIDEDGIVSRTHARLWSNEATSRFSDQLLPRLVRPQGLVIDSVVALASMAGVATMPGSNRSLAATELAAAWQVFGTDRNVPWPARLFCGAGGTRTSDQRIMSSLVARMFVIGEPVQSMMKWALGGLAMSSDAPDGLYGVVLIRYLRVIGGYRDG